MLYYFELYMHHNYCFRRKQHSYAACDAALAASIFLRTKLVNKKLKEKEENNCTRKLSNVRNILSIYLIAFEYALIAKESF